VLASGGHDGAVRLWGPGGDLVAELAAGAPWVEQVAWSEDSQLLATAAGKVVRVWTREGVLVAELPRQASTVTALGWRPGTRALPELATACYGGARLWRIGGAGAAPGQVEEPPQVAAEEWKGSVLAASWSPDGRRVATGAQDGLIHIWHPENDDKLEMGPYPSKVRTMAWSAKAGVLATIAGELLVLWSFSGAGPAGKKPAMLKGHKEEVLAVAAQERGPLLASGDADGVVAVWSPQGRSRPLVMVDLDDAVEQLAWAPGDRVLLAACAGGEVVALELE
jgi:WD40 repeat protein